MGFDQDRFTNNVRQADFFQTQYALKEIDSLVKIVFLGRLYPDKGWNFTLEAFEEIAQQIKMDQIALIIAGDGLMREEISQRLGKLTPNLYFLGRVIPEDVPPLLTNCDFHITTSEKEIRGLTILEAFAAGIPVLAPNSGGVTENIYHGGNRLLYSPGDRQDFCRQLKTLIENEPLRREMGDRARKSIQQYSWSQAIQNLVDIWQEAINKQLTPQLAKVNH